MISLGNIENYLSNIILTNLEIVKLIMVKEGFEFNGSVTSKGETPTLTFGSSVIEEETVNYGNSYCGLVSIMTDSEWNENEVLCHVIFPITAQKPVGTIGSSIMIQPTTQESFEAMLSPNPSWEEFMVFSKNKTLLPNKVYEFYYVVNDWIFPDE